jgi:hypothetical protein
MSAPTTTVEFLALLRKSGLIDESILDEEFPDESELPENLQIFAAGLVNRGLLTRASPAASSSAST